MSTIVFNLNLSSFGNMFLILKVRTTFIQIKLNGHFITEPKDVAHAFANHFKSIFNASYPSVTLPYSATTDFYLQSLSLPLKLTGL
jgi:hypothetical protein